MPHILDSKGRELHVGDRVRLQYPPPMPPASPLDDGKVLRFVQGLKGWGVEVEWPDMDSTCTDWYPTTFITGVGFICPDLTLPDPKQPETDVPNKRKGTPLATPDRSSR
jgi:hypothetical protein